MLLTGHAPATPAQPGRAAPTVSRRRTPWLWAAAAVSLVALGAGLAWWLVPRGIAADAPALPRVALLPIENETGDTALDWAVRGVPALMGSLLDQSRGFDMIDPLQVARAWEYKPAEGISRAEHTRAVTHAAVVIGGRLRRVADLYELTLSVDASPGRASPDITITGSEPGALAVAAIPRLRNALKLDMPTPLPSGATPQDPFVAQTFARGMNAAMHGKWSDAKPYFAVVAKSDPDFLAGRYRLAQAQIRTDQAAAAQETLRRSLSSATRRDTPEIAAQALKELAYISQLRHAFADTITLLEQARPFAERARNAEIQAQIAIILAQAEASLKHNDAARQSLETAGDLIDRNALHQLRPAFHCAEIFIANGRDDFADLEKAARASLAANQAIGDERGSTTAIFNVAYAMENMGRRVEALPLWSQAWQWARQHQDNALELRSGWYLASGLFNTGLDDRAAAIGLRDWHLPRANDAVLLRLAGKWASTHGNIDLARRVAERQQPLRDGASSTLGGISSDVPALAQDRPGS
ncbi:MAG: tetratricopeptide repeat protein [Rhodanobacteraceae bacterium]